jgi:hypothetical protein
MLRCGYPSDAAFLDLSGPPSLPLLSFMSLRSLSQKFYPLPRPPHALRHRATVPPSHSAFATAAPVAHSHLCLSLLAPAVPPAPLAPASLGVPPASAGARGAVARLRLVPGRPKGTHERGPMTVVLAPRGRNQPTLTSPLICCKCMFQVF